MPGESYTIDAQLRLNTGNAGNQLNTFAQRLSRVGQAIQGTNSGLLGMVSGFAGIATGIAVVHGLVGAFERLTGNAVAYRTAMEGLELQTSAVMSAVDRIDFNQARTRAHALFEQYRTDAIASVATTEQLVMISNAIMGPLRGAGQSMDVVRQMTNATVTASTALGVDLAQASRDMQLMVNGSAGMHVRLYQMLHATGAIAEDAHAFNALTSTERIARLQSALGRFQGAATAYGQSFAGATSTFQDIVDNLTSTFYGPAFNRLRQFLLDVNDRLIRNREALESVLTRAGNWFADHVQVAFDTMLSGMDYVGQHWDEIVTKGRAFIDQIRAVVPELMSAAKAWAAISLGRALLGGGVSGVGGIMSMLGGLRGGGGAAVAAATTAASAAGGLANLGAAGGAMAEPTDMFAAAAFRAGASLPVGMGSLGAAAAGPAEAGGLAALGAALAPMAPVIAIVAAGIVLITSLFVGISEHFSYFTEIGGQLMGLLQLVGGDLLSIGGDLWAAVQPLFELFGFYTANNAAGALATFLSMLHSMLLYVREGTIYLRDFGRWVHNLIGAPIDHAENETKEYINSLYGVQTASVAATSSVNALGNSLEDLAENYHGNPVDTHLGGTGITGRFGTFFDPTQGTAHAAPPVIDMRGARITQHMEFREADPDRVLMRSMEDLGRLAQARVSSGLSGLGR